MASSFRNLLGLPVKDWDTRADGQILVMGADTEHWEFAHGSGGGGVPYLVTDGDTYSVPLGIQALWTIPIELEGTADLDVSGYLVEVA